MKPRAGQSGAASERRLPDIEIGYARIAGQRGITIRRCTDGSRHAAQSQEQLCAAAYLAIARGRSGESEQYLANQVIEAAGNFLRRPDREAVKPFQP